MPRTLGLEQLEIGRLLSAVVPAVASTKLTAAAASAAVASGQTSLSTGKFFRLPRL